MGTKRAERKTNTNSSVDRKLNQVELYCTICPPNKGCNSRGRSKRGARKPKHKDKRG